MARASRTFRIFVSPTFSDLKEERNALQERVFPKLRELCMQHGARFQAIDLRWGVTEEEAGQGKVLEIILDEIDRSRPFFIGILGERYGSVPDNVPEDAKVDHPWLAEYPSHSLTAWGMNAELDDCVHASPDMRQ